MNVKEYVETIKDNERVVDLGCGHDPYPRADVFVDYYLEDDTQRDGASFRKDIVAAPGKKFVLWDLNKYPYPFEDKEFDFVIASHIAEHMDNPFSFCLEVQRIGKRGYIETPTKFYEQLYGWDFHKWYVYVEGDTLVFERINERTFTGSFIRNLYHVVRDPEFRNIHDENIPKLITAFYWEDGFPFKIIWGNQNYRG